MTSLEVGPLLISSLLIKVVAAKLNGQAERHSGMLKHMVKREIFDAIIGAVDVGVRVLKGGLDDKGRGVSGLGGRGVVGASIAALGLNPWNFAILLLG